MTAKILIVEDDEAMVALLRYNLEASGFEVVDVRRGDGAMAAAEQHKPALIVLDWMLPGLAGIEVCRRLRLNEATRGLPVIMMSAKALERDKLQAFEAGADDYVAKPFSVAELIVRIQGLLRRISQRWDAEIRTVSGLTIDTLAHQVRFDGRDVVLGPLEFRLLEYMLERSGRVLTRAQLIERVWRDAADVNERSVDIHIGHLRRALLDAGAPDLIKTVRGTGYALYGDGDGDGD